MNESNKNEWYWLEQTNNIIYALAPLEYELEGVAGVEFAKLRYNCGELTVEVLFENGARKTFDFTSNLQELYEEPLWVQELAFRMQSVVFKSYTYQEEQNVNV